MIIKNAQEDIEKVLGKIENLFKMDLEVDDKLILFVLLDSLYKEGFIRGIDLIQNGPEEL